MDRSAVAEPIDLLQNINDAVTMLQHKARRKSVSISVKVEPGTPRAVAVGGELGQVWTNLVDNAIDAAPDHSTVEITAAPQGTFVIVRVVDSGPGVPEEFRARIFDPFFTTKPVGQGTGLGLDIALKIVRGNGGDMEVESTPGRTEFRVTLPAESRG
jgi:signal transduction histidine kinase